MKGFMKKAAAIAVAGMMAVTTLAGCASEPINYDEVVATVGEKEISLALANFYIRYQQSAIESTYMSYYGDAMWTLEVEEGVTYEESVREDAIDSIKHLYILEAHMDEYNVTVTEDELAAIDKAAEAFVEANSEEVIEVVSGQKEVVAEVLKLITISNKMEQAMVADVNTDVSDDEAAQKKMAYVSFSKTTTDEDGESVDLTEDELAELKTDVEAFLKAAKTNGDLEAYAEETEETASTLTFDSETTTLDEDVIKAADALEEKAFADVIETDSAFYVLQLVSKFDEDATEDKKEEIVEERKTERYNEIFDEWDEATEYKLDEKVLAKIDLQDIGVTLKAEETEEDSEE